MECGLEETKEIAHAPVGYQPPTLGYVWKGEEQVFLSVGGRLKVLESAERGKEGGEMALL